MNCIGVSSAIAKLEASGLAESENWIGCNEAQISQLEAHFLVSLPECYKKFLAKLGQDSGDFMSSTEFVYSELFGLRAAAEALLAENHSVYSLPPSAFVIMFHGGYNFALFICDGDPDPPVYRYEDCDPEPKQVADSFSEWIGNLIDGYLEVLRKL